MLVIDMERNVGLSPLLPAFQVFPVWKLHSFFCSEAKNMVRAD